MLNGLDLFSGIGGISLALRDFIKTVAYCEIDPFCQSVLLQRMQEGNLPQAPIWPDVRTLPHSELPAIDIIYGGFPCQDISVAGLGKGLAGERSGLFFEIMRLAKEIKPKFLFLENVSAITARGGLQVVRTIAEMGYDCRWCVISAASVGALHKRERWFLLANSSSQSSKGYSERKEKEYSMPSQCSIDGNSHSFSSEQADKITESKQTEGQSWRGSSRQYWPFESTEHWQEAVSTICRVTDGLPNQMDRLRSLGNAVVPQQVLKAFTLLMGIENELFEDPIWSQLDFLRYLKSKAYK